MPFILWSTPDAPSVKKPHNLRLSATFLLSPSTEMMLLCFRRLMLVATISPKHKHCLSAFSLNFILTFKISFAVNASSVSILNLRERVKCFTQAWGDSRGNHFPFNRKETLAGQCPACSDCLLWPTGTYEDRNQEGKENNQSSRTFLWGETNDKSAIWHLRREKQWRTHSEAAPKQDSWREPNDN